MAVDEKRPHSLQAGGRVNDEVSIADIAVLLGSVFGSWSVVCLAATIWQAVA